MSLCNPVQRYGRLLPQCDRQDVYLLHTDASLHQIVDSKSVALTSCTSVSPTVHSMICLTTSDGTSSIVAIATANQQRRSDTTLGFHVPMHRLGRR